MAQVLRRLDNLTPLSHPDLIVGIGGSDDAGVFRISDSVALVQTVDFFTPIVDEPGDWGRIAAVNALSDVYAMGGTPLTALQLVGWPRDTLPFEMLGDVLEGAAEVLAEAGVTLVGGHSIDDREPKFGLAVTGVVHPDHVLSNTGARPGDALVLTKPLGTGVIATAIKRGVAPPELRDEAVSVMLELNRPASEAARAAGARAMTDVTGYGLLGHLHEMLGEVGATVEVSEIRFIDGVRELAADGVVPGGSRRNLDDAAAHTDFGDLDEVTRILLADAQTSGGLLIAVPPGGLQGLLEAVPGAVRIGTFTASTGRIEVA